MADNNEVTNWGAAAPAGVSALSTGVLAIYALMMGFAPPETMPILAAILIVCALCQTIAGIIEYKRGDTAFAFCLLNFGLVLQGGTALILLAKIWAQATGRGLLPPQMDGWIWLGFTVMIGITAPAIARLSWSVFAIIIEVDIAALLFSFINLGLIGPWLIPLVAHLFLIFALYMFYVGLVVMTNTVAKKPVFPLGGPLIKS